MLAHLPADVDGDALVAAATGWHDLAVGEHAGPLDDGTAILAERAVLQALDIADAGGIGALVIPVHFWAVLDSVAYRGEVDGRCCSGVETGDAIIVCLLEPGHPGVCPVDRVGELEACW